MTRQGRGRPTVATKPTPTPVRKGSRIKRKRVESVEKESLSTVVETRKSTRIKRQKAQEAPKPPASPTSPSLPPPPQAPPTPRKAPQMTDAYVRSLLPGSMFGVADEIFSRGIWGTAHEHALRHQQFVASPDFKRFQQEQLRIFQAQVPRGLQSPFDAEVRLWGVLQHRFRCGLNDFFRYGLRPAVQRKMGEGERDEGLPRFVEYCAKLTTILVHPMWTADIAPVRWILQRVIQERVQGHVRPLVPPYSYAKRPFAHTARQWGFDTSMRISLEEEIGAISLARAQQETGTETETSSSRPGGFADSNFLQRLSSVSQEAARAAIEAEAEIAWFLFSTSAPRELWYLDRMLKHDDDQSAEEVVKEEEEEEEEDDEEEDDNPFDLRVCDDIIDGYFGHFDDHYDDEPTRRQDSRRREDNLMYHARGRNQKTSFLGDNLRDDQVFFDLTVQDLDRLMQLMSVDQFRFRGLYDLPYKYYMGYVRAHEALGYKDNEKEKIYGSQGMELEQPPLLTCLQCAQKYHQSGGNGHDKEHHYNHDHDHDHDHDHNHDDHHDYSHSHSHSHDIEDDEDEHGHYLHQQFILGGDTDNALKWLMHRKCEWLLSGCREKLIQAALAEGDGFKIPSMGRERALLPDIPPFDPPPLGWHDRVFTNPSQLAVLERAQNVTHSSVLWCLGGE